MCSCAPVCPPCSVAGLRDPKFCKLQGDVGSAMAGCWIRLGTVVLFSFRWVQNLRVFHLLTDIREARAQAFAHVLCLFQVAVYVANGLELSKRTWKQKS